MNTTDMVADKIIQIIIANKGNISPDVLTEMHKVIDSSNLSTATKQAWLKDLPSAIEKWNSKIKDIVKE